MRLFSRLLVLTAFFLSAYMAWTSLSSGHLAGCGGGTPCDKVLQSVWAYIGPVPVSVPALTVYALLFLFSFLPEKRNRLIDALILVLGAAVTCMVLWFTALQVAIIGALCPFCMGSHLSGLAGALSLIRHRAAGHGEVWKARALPAVLAGVFLSAGFVVLQVVLPGPDRSVTYTVQTERTTAHEHLAQSKPMDPKADETVPPAVGDFRQSSPAKAQPPVDPQSVPAEEDLAPNPGAALDTSKGPALEAIYRIHDGRFSYPVRELPGIGDPAAPNIMLNLIDFACDHCRVHYRVLRKSAPRFEGEIFFAVLPLPLNERCNPYFSMPGLPDFANCQYARLALAVWKADRDKYPEVVDWLCQESSPPASLEASQLPLAMEHAAGVVGKAALLKAWDDPWVMDTLRQTVELYGYNLKETGQNAIPQQFLNHTLRFGEITTESAFDMTMGLYFPIEIKRRR